VRDAFAYRDGSPARASVEHRADRPWSATGTVGMLGPPLSPEEIPSRSAIRSVAAQRADSAHRQTVTKRQADRPVPTTLTPARAAWVIPKARRHRLGDRREGRSHGDNPLRRAGCGIRQDGVGCPQGAAVGSLTNRPPAPWGQPLGRAAPERRDKPAKR